MAGGVEVFYPEKDDGPVVFFSYFRQDAVNDNFMREFWEALSNELAERGGQLAEACFHDRLSIQAGDPAEKMILDALRRSHVFVAMYTPRYFRQFEKPCYCGKEFAAFWRRSDPDHTPHNIVPVLWIKQGDNFLPEPVSQLKVSTELNEGGATPAARKLYEKEGLKRLRIRMKRAAYNNVVADLVDLILERAAVPLPPLSEDLPSFASLPCCFHDHQTATATYPICSPGELASAGGPKRVVLIYAVDAEGLAAEITDVELSRLLYYQGYDAQVLRWPVDTDAELLRSSVEAATGQNRISLIVVPSHLSSSPDVVAKLRSLRTVPWVGGILTVAGPAVPVEATPTTEVRTLAASPGDLAGELSSVLSFLRGRMNVGAAVHQPVTGPGPDNLPRF